MHHEVDEIADAVHVRQHLGDGDVLQLGIFRPQPIDEAKLQQRVIAQVVTEPGGPGKPAG